MSCAIAQIEPLGGSLVIFVNRGAQEPATLGMQGDGPLPVGAACGVAVDLAQLHHSDAEGQSVI